MSEVTLKSRRIITTARRNFLAEVPVGLEDWAYSNGSTLDMMRSSSREEILFLLDESTTHYVAIL